MRLDGRPKNDHVLQVDCGPYGAGRKPSRKIALCSFLMRLQQYLYRTSKRIQWRLVCTLKQGVAKDGFSVHSLLLWIRCSIADQAAYARFAAFHA